MAMKLRAEKTKLRFFRSHERELGDKENNILASKSSARLQNHGGKTNREP